MSEFIWYWVKGSIRIYTRNRDLVEKALKEGFLVVGIKRALKFARLPSNEKMVGVK